MEEGDYKEGMTKDEIYNKLEKFQTNSEKIRFLHHIEPKISQTTPQTQKAYYETLGDLSLKKEEFEQAAEYYKKAGKDEMAERIWERLGDIGKVYHEDDQAINHYEKANASQKKQELVKKQELHSLENKFLLVLAFCSFLFSLMFFSGRITGNTIAQSPFGTHNLVGAGLFVMGLIVAFLYSETRK